MSFPLSFYNNEWDYWQLYHKVTFDGENKTIRINPGVTSINVQVDIYSDWKEWAQLHDNLKFEQALTTTGGDPLPGSLLVGRYFFLLNGWKLVPPVDYADLAGIEIDGNLFSDDGSDIFVTAETPGAILIRQTVSQYTQIDTFGYTASVSVTASLDPSTTVTASVVTSPVTLAANQYVTASLVPGTVVTASLSTTEATMLLEMYRLLGLDPTKPLVVTPNARTVDTDISQSILQSGDTVTVTRT